MKSLNRDYFSCLHFLFIINVFFNLYYISIINSYINIVLSVIMPITNQALYDKITVLENIINKLSDIISYQSKNIESLKDENSIIIQKVINLDNKIDNNSIIQAVKIDSIAPKINNKLINNNILLTTDIEDTIDYSIKSTYLNFLKEKLDITIEEENIIKIKKLKYKSDNNKPLKYNKFVISLNNSKIKSSILKNKNQLKDTNIYIQEFLDTSTNNIFFNTRKLRSENKIINTWIYNNNIFIETNDNKRIQIINQLHLENIIDNISL